MPKVIHQIAIEQKRPKDLTPKKLRRLKKAGQSVIELAKFYGLSRARIYQLLKK